MNALQVLDHFDRISDAPDAIPRLRRFILDLAVRGKLVEQDANDEPVSELLRRMGAVESGDVPFQIPNCWQWVSIGQIAECRLGKMLDKAKNKGSPRRYLRNVNVRWFDFDLSDVLEMRFEDSEVDEFSIRSGDVLICEGGEPGRAAVWDEREADIYFQKAIHRMRLPKSFNPHYFVNVFRVSAESGRLAKYFTGVGIKHFTGKGLSSFLVPLPPLDEQYRIVSKVDELMALCDRLEAAQTERDNRRDKLTAASQHRLNNGADADDFREHVRFHLRHLPRLTTRPEHIQQLRQAILNLAIRGKLVPQDPNDEPATELLDRIQAEKGRLEKEGKIKREKPVEAVRTDAAPFAIPEIWRWARLGELTELITKGSSPKWQGVGYVSKDNGVLFITSENVGNYKLRKLDELKYVEKRFNEIEPRSILRFGDILMNLVGASIGRTAIYDLCDKANINQAVAIIRLIQTTTNLSTAFLLHYLNSTSAIQLMFASQVVTAQPNISLTNAREFPVPVPPLAEQHRIVAKVEELMALCHRLEVQLNTTRSESRRLLEAILHYALSGAK